MRTLLLLSEQWVSIGNGGVCSWNQASIIMKEVEQISQAQKKPGLKSEVRASIPIFPLSFGSR